MVDHVVRRSPFSSLSQSVLGWTTLGLVLFVAVFHGGNAPVYWTLLGFAVMALFVLQVALTAIRGGHWANRRLTIPAILYLGAVAWCLAQTLPGLPADWAHPLWALAPEGAGTVSATPVAGMHGVLRLVTYAMVFWIAVQASMNARRSLAFLKAFAFYSTALALFGLYAVLVGENVVLGEQATPSVSATFVNRNSYALYAAFGLFANVAVYLDMVRSSEEPASRRSALRSVLERFFSGAWVFLFGALMCLSALLLSTSRAGVASGLVGLAVLVLLLQRKRGGSGVVWLSLAVVVGAFLTVLSENVLARFASGAGELRFVVYPEIVAHLGDRLMQGHGLAAFQDTFRPLVPFEAAGAEWSRAHNSYLENLWEMGLPAALAFYGALLIVAVVILRGAVVRQRNRVFPVVACAALVAGGLHSLVDFSLQMPATAALFAFLLGIGWAHAWPRGVGSLAERRREDTEDDALPA
ncbi:O-antigen ligase family protein [Roseicyclus sp.]|uniref:O-antigen ligase family protein n=1 Tax=Roseicyclus sp. TaxID=1914329 RepID=UPI003F9FAF2E